MKIKSQYSLYNICKYGLGVKKKLKNIKLLVNKANTNKLIKNAKDYAKNLEGSYVKEKFI